MTLPALRSRSLGQRPFLTLLAALLPLVLPVHAEPIRPVSLRQLVDAASVVAVMRAESVSPVQPTRARIGFAATLEDRLATMRAVDTLQGSVAVGSRVGVVFRSGESCPAYPYFRPGADYLLFLETAPEYRAYRPVALTYGAKSFPSLKARLLYLAFVRRYIAIKAIPDPLVRHASTVDWLCDGLLSPSTRWDCAYDLSPVDPYADPEFVRLGDFRGRMRPDQVTSAVDVLRTLDLAASVRSIEHTDRHCLIELARRYRRRDASPLLLAALRRYTPSTDSLCAFLTMRAYACLESWPRGGKLAQDFLRSVGEPATTLRIVRTFLAAANKRPSH